MKMLFQTKMSMTIEDHYNHYSSYQKEHYSSKTTAD